MRQEQIEKYAGINEEAASYMMKSATIQARNAMGLLSMAVSLPDACTITLLKEAVNDCKKDMKNENTHQKRWLP